MMTLAIGFVLSEAALYLGPEEMARKFDDALAFLGRYGKQDMIRLARDVPTVQVFKWVIAVSDLIKRENEAAKR